MCFLTGLYIWWQKTVSCNAELQNPCGGKGPQEVSRPTPCSEQGDHWAQMGLLRALSNGSSKPPRMEGIHLLWANLSQCLIILIVKIIFCVSSPFSVYGCCLWLSCHARDWRAWLCLLTDLLLGAGRLLFDPHLRSLTCLWNTSVQSASSQICILLCQGKKSQHSQFPFAAAGPQNHFHWWFWRACGNGICKKCDYYFNGYSLL